MRRRAGGALLVFVLVLAALSCRTPPRPYVEPPPPGVRPTTIDYTDTDGFDALFETALVSQDPAILISTTHVQPDWGPRLNAWIAAWNRGGKVGPPPRTVRGQAPSVTVDGENLREFRLLIEGLMDRVEDIAARQSAWWAEERTLSHRVALLRPYNLRFHRDEEKRIQLIFFNGNYAPSYPDFMKAVVRAEGDEPMEWSRTMRCSWCRTRELGAAGAE